jgi:hypothetical protein
MGALSSLLLLTGLLFIVYNLILNLTNLTRIVNYCFDTNSLDQYWSLFYKACFHKKAIYSSIIISVISAFLFIVISPLIFIKGIFAQKEMEERRSSGAHFKYADTDLIEKKFGFSNINELGIDKFESTATGNVKLDFVLAMGYIEEHCKNKNLKITQSVFETYDLNNKMRVLIPVTIGIGEKSYPMYLIYNQEHKDSYQKINPILKENHFENALYLSVVPM